jgi:ubiquinone/menaquinone biosynthesis C-methylase UbiE
MRRHPTLELLDSDSGTPAEVAASIRDLRWFNRWFGGIRTTRLLLETVARKTGKTDFSLLEVAAGEGYVLQALRRKLELSHIHLSVTLLDRVPSHLTQNGAMPKIAMPMIAMPKIGADALHLPFADAAFDLVSSSLFVHHLSPHEVVAFASEALRVARIAVLVHDLVRHPFHLALAYAGTPVYRSRITRNDAPASVRQAYTVTEMQTFFHQAGAANVEVQTHFLFRMGAIAWKRNFPDA